MWTWAADKAWPHLVASMKAQPVIWLSLAALCWYGWTALEGKADAAEIAENKKAIAAVQGDISSIQITVANLEKRQQLRDLRDRISRIQSDLLSIDRDIEKFKKDGQQIPNLYVRQKEDLEGELSGLEGEMQEFRRDNPNLARER